jgi:hypothetical protein
LEPIPDRRWGCLSTPANLDNAWKEATMALENHSYPKTPRVPDSNKIPIERGLIKSKAWLSLQGRSTQVYMLFLYRQKVKNVAKKGHRKHYVCYNNGQIEFSYRYAEKEYGITRRQFVYALDSLVEAGFIDIIQPGSSCGNIPSLYAISERWRLYGTDKFVEATRTKGFRVGQCSPEKSYRKNKMSAL